MSMLDVYEQRCAEDSDISQHLPRLFAEASIDNVKVIELGVRTGNSTSAFLAAAEEYDGHVWSVDIEQPDVTWGDHPQWTLFIGHDITIADQLPNDADVVFIDSSHDYTHTLAELKVYLPKVKPGGVILLHDTELTRNPRHRRSHRRDEQPDFFPVRTAVDEFCAAHNLTPEFVTGSYGLGVIRV